MKCTVRLIWDIESNKWYTDSDDALCLNLESSSFDTLIERVRMAAPEMLELNCGYSGPIQITFEALRKDYLEKVS